LNQLDRARSALRRAIAIQPVFPAAHNQLGVIHTLRVEYPDAIRHFTIATEQDPLLAVAHYNLGCIYVRVQQFETAAIELERAKLLDAENTEVRYNLAYALARLGKNRSAIAEIKMLLSNNPGDSNARTMLIVLYLLSRNRTEALAELQNSQRSGYECPMWLRKTIFRNIVVTVDDLARK